MNKHHIDLLVIGSGPGGQKAAIAAAKLGKKVVMVERKPYIGGAGIQTGTIPSKALREAAYLSSRIALRGMRDSMPTVEQQGNILERIIKQKNSIVTNNESISHAQLKRNYIQLVIGEASFIDANTMRIKCDEDNEKIYTAQTVILATGSRPRRPKHVPFDKERILDSTSIMRIKELPKRLLVVGGGVIACEFVTMFAPLGVEVQIVDRHEHLLSYLDHDMTNVLATRMKDMGVKLEMNTKVTEIRREEDTVFVTLENGEVLETDTLLYAQGRQPNIETLNIEAAGIATDDWGWITCNELGQTSQPSVYIIGDLVGSPALASTAMEQGRLASLHAFSQENDVVPSLLPMAIYTIPEISTIGSTEQELIKNSVEYIVGRARFSDTARGQIIGDYEGQMKIIVEKSSLSILGIHIIGESASELIHIGQIIMSLGGTVKTIVENVFNYPTLAECYKTAALDCMNQINQARIKLEDKP